MAAKKKNNDVVIPELDINLFRRRLQKRCTDLGMSHPDLAQKAGVSLSLVEKCLYGKKSDIDGEKKPYYPSLQNVYSMAQALGVSIDYFVNPDFDCLTVQNQMIHDYTGLSDRAINALVNDNKKPLHIVDTINLLLGHIGIHEVTKLFLDTYMYLLTTPKYFKSLDGSFKDNYVILESDFENTKYPALRGLGVGLYSENVGGVFLHNITSHLSAIKLKLQK